MNKVTKIIIMVVVVYAVVFLGINRYAFIQKEKKKLVYMTSVEKEGGTILIGGMYSDKGKIDGFKRELEKDGPAPETKATAEEEIKAEYEKMNCEQRIAKLKAWNPKTDFEKFQKEALLHEANGEYETAAISYKEIISTPGIKEELVPMIHCALQRCYENSRNIKDERIELIWINDNIFAENGEYNNMKKYLTRANLINLHNRMVQLAIPSKSGL